MTGEERNSEQTPRSETESSLHAGTPHDFRWQGLFQKSKQALFLLNRRRRILFVNHAWEELTGLTAAEARGLVCLRNAPAGSEPWDLVVRALCCPPPEAIQGNPVRAYRLVPGAGTGQKWWNIDFFPIGDQAGRLCILGKITVELREGP